MSGTFPKVLIANRGEVSVRISRTLKDLQCLPVAIFSEADQKALHVRKAHEAYHVGPAPSSESYLNVERIVGVAKHCGATFVHPGYGFLSENASFAQACEEEGLVFVGPKAETIAQMGDKIQARALAEKAGLSLLPASGPLSSVEDARQRAQEIGFPVLIKAKAGGGGKGMRAVSCERELTSAYQMAKSEAQQSFSDDTLYMEKCLVRPRHIEVQIFSDLQGHVISLGDRECSVQRRHQKVIEEAPAPNLKPETHEALALAAETLARAVHYVGAGTVEFLVDESENFFFLEMNTRLQVEHPVTEWITCQDLVAWQMRVAQEKSLPLKQEEVSLQGHSIEVRLYAEDPENSFFPSPGTVKSLAWPLGPGVRVDSGVETGSVVSVFYDPLLAKITAWGASREEARLRLLRALNETHVLGMKTNLSFLKQALAHSEFVHARVTTSFIQEHFPFSTVAPSLEQLMAAIAAAHVMEGTKITPRSTHAEESESGWWLTGLPHQSKGPSL